MLKEGVVNLQKHNAELKAVSFGSLRRASVQPDAFFRAESQVLIVAMLLKTSSTFAFLNDDIKSLYFIRIN